MGRPTGHGLPLDAHHAAFMQDGVSVVVSARNQDLVPDVVRACGCRVSPDRRRVTVLVEAARAGSVLENVAANGQIAVVFSQPSTHHTIQVKGTDAKRGRVTSADRALAERHLNAWADDMQTIGYAPEFSRAAHGEGWQDLAAITFTPTAAFQQTPGPAAGQRLTG